jgi:hypothetical protein
MGFFYNNSDYGIASNSIDLLKNVEGGGNTIIWFWNQSDSEFPSSTTFTETGLPNNGESWNVIYNGNLLTAVVPNSIMFFNNPTTAAFPYSVASQVVSTTTFNAFPNTGTGQVGQLVPISFSTASLPTQTCGITLSNSVISFGNINPGFFSLTSNRIVDTNAGGTAAANILVSGSNWISSGTANFFVANTLWNPTSASNAVGTSLPLFPSFTITGIPLAAAGTGNIFFGIGVPPAQPLGLYTANIIIENSC